MFVRLMRSPEGSESTGAAVLEAPATAAAENATPEPAKEAKPEPQAAKPEKTDWDVYEGIKKKEANGKTHFTKRELAIARKYEGKDESVIEGFKKPSTPDAEEDEAPAKPKAKEPEEDAEEVQEADPLEPVLKAVGAKDKAELGTKVKGLVAELKKLSGSQGEVGRLLKEAGVPDLKGLRSELQASRRLDELVKDLKAGRPEAFAYIGINKPAQAKQLADGEIPEGVLDDGLFRHVSPQLKAANERVDKLERELRAIHGKLEPWERTQAETATQQLRTTQLNQIVTEASTLADGNDGLWDSKRNGSLGKALVEYYNTSGDHNPALNPIIEILDLAKEHNLPNLEVAFAYWRHKNGGLIRPTNSPVNRQPNVGLSDRQGANTGGQFKTFTEAHVKEMVDGKRAIPKEWTDAGGNIIASQVPAHLRKFVDPED
jgi:hypothetical protein